MRGAKIYCEPAAVSWTQVRLADLRVIGVCVADEDLPLQRGAGAICD